MRIAWLILALPLATYAASSNHWDHELLLAGAGSSLEVTLISHSPLPLSAQHVRDWLQLPDVADCTLLRAPRNAPANEADRPMTRYIWQFHCAQLGALSELSFNAPEAQGKLYLQWVLPRTQGKALMDEPVSDFDFSAANQSGGIL